VLARTSGDIFVSVWIDIGICSQRNRRAQVFGAGDLVDVIKLGFALDIETVNTLVEGVLDFLARFTDAGECAFRWIAAGVKHTKKFAAGNDVEARTGIGEQFQDSAV